VSPPADPAELDDLVQALLAGSVVGVPTDTVYGLAVDPRVPGAVDRVFAVKGRPSQLALPVLVADPAQLSDLAEPSSAAGRLASHYWPGPLTVVLRRRPGVDFDLGGDVATIGIRCADHEVLRALLRKSGPLAVTSANRHREHPLHTAGEVRERFGADVASVLDGGRCDGQPSTVISLAGPHITCIREGSISFAEIDALAAGQ
jgi:L-threonylcarbamoyladenylate synthase